MATVPYNPVPDVTFREAPVGPVHVDANPNMFGAAVGSALEQAGGVAERSGDEIFQRAMAMQELHNQTVARDAQAQYMSQQGELHANFTSQQGAAAGPEALKGYIQQSNDLRGQIANGIDSPAARQMFDNDSTSFLGRNIFNAAGHSAQQMKNYAIGTSKAVLDNTANQALQNPADEISFKAALESQRQNAQQLSMQMGYEPGSAEAKDVEDRSVSTLVGSRIAGYARTNPLLAKQLYQGAISDGSLRGQDIEHVGNLVNNQVMTGGSKIVADGINNGSSLLLGQNKVSIERAKDAIGGYESGNNYASRGPLLTSGPYKGQQAMGRYGIMPGNLPSWLQEAGMPPMSVEQFIKSPAAQDQLFEKRFGADMNKYGNFNDPASVWLSGQPMNKQTGAKDQLGTDVPKYLQETNARLANTASIDEKVATAQDHMGKIAPDVPLAQDAVKERVLQQAREQEAQRNLAQRQTQSTIDTSLAGLQGKTPGTFDDWLHSSPDLSKAFYSLDGQKQLSVMQKYRQQVASDDIPSPARDAKRQELVGLAQNDPEKFLDSNLYSQDLTAGDRKFLVGQRQKMLQGATTEPHLHVALGVLQNEMNAAGLNRKDDSTNYDIFTGALADQIHAFQGDKQRLPNRQEITDIGRRLLTTQVTTPGRLWGTNETNLYQAQPPETYTTQMKRQYPTATDEQIRARFVRDQYRLAVGKEANAQH